MRFIDERTESNNQIEGRENCNAKFMVATQRQIIPIDEASSPALELQSSHTRRTCRKLVQREKLKHH